MRPCLRFFGTAVLLVFAPALVFGQFTSSIEGRVADPSDAGVPKAMVTIENTSTGVKRSVETSEVGYYRFASLPPGSFNVRVTAPGFETCAFEGISLENDQTKTFNLAIKVGQSSTQVTVTTELPLV